MRNDLVKEKLDSLRNSSENVTLMEVCGTHTMAISKFGIRSLLPSNINLISGPGCPVCVTPDIYLDYIYDLSLKEKIIVATYGDMIRVPGSEPHKTLENAKAKGAEVRVVYSSMDAVKLAEENRDKKVVFLGIGFETTAPATAIALMEAKKKQLSNFYVLSVHKIVEPVMRLLLEDKEIKIDGFIIPGHVAVILGESGFKFIENYKCAGVITGFELSEVVNGIYDLVQNIKNENYKVGNDYKILVKENGNEEARNILKQVFEVRDDLWRGMGSIKNSGLKLNDNFRKFDIESVFPVDYSSNKTNKACSCGEVLKGKVKPGKCKMFGKVCNPDNPLGPCMVSHEGTCAAYFRYND